MMTQEEYEALQSVSNSVSNRLNRPDMADDLVQELWIGLATLKEKYDPAQGLFKPFLYRHAEYTLKGMLRKVKELHVETLFEYEQGIDSNGGELVLEEVEDALILEMDKRKALERVREKLKRNGCGQLRVISNYNETKKRKKEARASRGTYDTADHQRLIDLIKPFKGSKAQFASQLGISAQRLQSYTSREVQVIPEWLLKKAEEVVFCNAPARMTQEEMIEWTEGLIVMIASPDEAIRRKEEHLASIVNVTRTTIMRWRKGVSRLMPQKAELIQRRVQQYAKNRELIK